LTPFLEGNPFTKRYEIMSQESKIFVASHIKDFVILACIVFIDLKQGVTDGRTNGRVDDSTIVKTRLA